MHNDRIKQLRALARDVQNYQIERGWSDSKICSQIANIGSTKTYKRILDEADPLDQMDVEKQIRSYEAAVELIKARRGKDRPPEPEYEDFANIVDSRAAVARALQEDSIARFVVIEGENGTGKDAVKNALLDKWSKIIVPVEATELWRESMSVPLADIINALSIRRQTESGEKFKMPNFPAARLELIIEELKNRKLVLLINEGHHMGPRSLNLIKTLINQTPVVPVMLCIPKLLQRLVSSAYEEAIQLFGNRLCERVRLNAPAEDEILLMFERRGVRFADVQEENLAAQALARESAHFGNWRYIVQVTREAREMGAGKAMTLKTFTEAQTRARSRRVSNQQMKA